MSIADKLATVAENVPKVYDAGKKAEHDAFWRRFTHNGERKSYYSAFFRTDFSGETIPEGLCKPQRQDATFAAMDRMFYQYIGTTLPKGIDATLAANNDSVGAQLFTASTYLTEIYDMGIPVSSSMTNWYAYCNGLHTIEKIRVNENTTFKNTFQSTPTLKNVTFEGVISQNISFSYSPLSVASLKNIIKHLKDYAGTSSEFAYTLTVKASAWEALEAEGINNDDSAWILSNIGFDVEAFEGTKWSEIVNMLGWNLVLAS